MAKGASGLSGSSISAKEKKKITDDIINHTKEQNDGAANFYISAIANEKNSLEGYKKAEKAGLIRRDDQRWEYHEGAYKSLVSRYDFFKKERKRLNK